ncbi:MAG: glutamine synthetase family protein [Alphaproteobacteria bacterium]
MDIKSAAEFLRANAIDTVIAAGPDQVGTMRGKRFTAAYFLEAAERGFRMPWSILNTGTMDEAVPGLFDGGIPDVKGVPDLATLGLAPWEPGAAAVLMDWTWPDGRPCELCPRRELKRQIGRLRSRGFVERVALELEFVVLPVPVAEIRRGRWADIAPAQKDVHCYAIYEGHFLEPMYQRVRECFGAVIEGGGPEWGPGQFEINLRASDALAMADTVMLFKTAVKQICAGLGFTATFMAKWHHDHSGNSGHIHQSLTAAGTGRSAFHDPADPQGMSTIMRQYLAGQLAALAPTTLFLAPFVNSYKRLREDSLAGVVTSWGLDNRTVAGRAITSDAGSCRIEHRVPGADVNPYVALAVLLGAGLMGIEDAMTPPPAAQGNAYHAPGAERVPRDLAEAYRLADQSPLTRRLLPPAFVENFLTVVRLELDAFATMVTDLERRRGLEMA